MDKPLISIIVPVYNVAPYVEDCIRSVMRQTYEGKMECIIVDDCGTDDSMAIVERIIEDYNGPISFKILHHTHNRGLSAARNTGMNAAIGDYLFFLDSDDELTDDCFEKLTKPLETEWYDVVVGNILCFEMLPSNQKKRKSSAQELKIKEDTLLYQPDLLQTHRKIWGQASWNKLYRITLIRQKNLSFKEGLLHEDNLWSFQIACLASSLYCVNSVTYKYVNKRKGGITFYETNQEISDNLIIIIKEMSLFVDNNHINVIDVYSFFNNFFNKVLNANSTSLSIYVKTYKQVRANVRVSLKGMLQANQYNFKKCLHDFHYLFPMSIAPYWQYYIYFRLRPLIKKNEKKNN